MTNRWESKKMNKDAIKPLSGIGYQGFNLIELMIVVAIIAVIMGIAIPTYNKQTTESRRTDGQKLLMEIMQAQQRHFSENLTYVSTLTTLGYSSDSNFASEEGYYLVSASTCDSPYQQLTQCVKLTATPQGSQADDGTLTLDSFGAKSW